MREDALRLRKLATDAQEGVILTKETSSAKRDYVGQADSPPILLTILIGQVKDGPLLQDGDREPIGLPVRV